MARKRPNLVQNIHIWSFWAKYCLFLHILSNARPKTNVNKVPRWVFRYLGNKTFDFSSKKKGFFAQKRPNLVQNWLFLSIAGSFGALLVGWLVVLARAVSRKTPIYFIVTFNVDLINTLALTCGSLTNWKLSSQNFLNVKVANYDLLRSGSSLQCHIFAIILVPLEGDE